MKNQFKLIISFITALISAYLLSQTLIYGTTELSLLIETISRPTGKIEGHKILFFIVIAGFGLFFSLSKSYLLSIFSIEAVVMLKNKTINHILHLQMNEADNVSAGRLINIITSDFNLIEKYMKETFPKLITAVFTILTIGVSIYNLSNSLLVQIMLCCTAVTVLSYLASTKLALLAKGRKTRIDILLNLMNDYLQGILTARAYNLYQMMHRKVNAAIEEILSNEYRRNKISSYSWVLQTITEWLPPFMAIGLIFIQAEQFQMGIGDISYMVLILNRLFKPFSELPMIMNETFEGYVSFGRLYGIFDLKTEVAVKSDIDSSADKYALELKDISLGYVPETNILNNISFKVPQGSTLAIVGGSGCGKSTIFNLLCRFIRPTGGSFFLFGMNTDCEADQNIRKCISVVSQDTFLFNTTIYENISYGNSSATEAEIYAACKQANIHENILAKDNGYETYLYENGSGLSGGEKQRISLARAILKDAPILLLDEPTSSLDTDTERLIMDTLNKIGDNKTIITIAHRLSTIKDADQIIVLKDGQIAECGTHLELMANKKHYYDMHNEYQEVAGTDEKFT